MFISAQWLVTDTELFTAKTKARLAVWNSTAASYSDHVEKTRCWESLCSKVFPDFEMKTLTKRNKLGKAQMCYLIVYFT